MDHTQLIEAYLRAKGAEEAACNLRRSLGEELVSALGAMDEGSITHACGEYKVTLKSTVNRKVDWDEWDAVAYDLKDPPCKTKRELDLPGLKWYRENDPETYAKLAKAITATPGATQIEIKEKK